MLAEHIMGAASGRPSPNGAGGLRPPAPFREFSMCPASIKNNWRLHILRTLATHFSKSIGHPPFLKVVGIKNCLSPPANM